MKGIFVVTETFLDLKKNSVNTFVTGISDDLYGAQKALRDAYEYKLKLGYKVSHFVMDHWSWTYIHDYGLVRAEIQIRYFNVREALAPSTKLVSTNIEQNL